LLGLFENFPKQVHALASFEHQETVKDVQKAVLCTFHRLNNEVFDLGVITPFLTQQCKVGFEFGVAEGFDFSFLDQNELDHCLKFVDGNEMQTLDFFFVVRYHISGEDGKWIPLRFDYHVLRFVFHENKLEMRIRHERGSQRVTPDDLTDYITKKINSELSRRQLMPLFSGAFEKMGIS
jgi:hypothetical protein